MTEVSRAARTALPCLRLLYTKPSEGKPADWRGVVSQRTLRAKSDPGPDALPPLFHRRALLWPGTAPDQPLDREKQQLISMTLPLARAVRTVLTDKQFVTKLYELSTEPVKHDQVVVGLQLVWTRLLDVSLVAEVETSVRGLLGEQASAIEERMWDNLAFLIGLLPPRLEGPIGYYYHGVGPAGIRTMDIRLPEKIITRKDAAAHLIGFCGNEAGLFKMLQPTRAAISVLWQAMPAEQAAPSQPTVIDLD